jgi:hypothetical protein
MKCNSKENSRLLIFLCVFDVVKIMQRAKGGGAQSSPPSQLEILTWGSAPLEPPLHYTTESW